MYLFVICFISPLQLHEVRDLVLFTSVSLVLQQCRSIAVNHDLNVEKTKAGRKKPGKKEGGKQGERENRKEGSRKGRNGGEGTQLQDYYTIFTSLHLDFCKKQKTAADSSPLTP